MDQLPKMDGTSHVGHLIFMADKRNMAKPVAHAVNDYIRPFKSVLRAETLRSDRIV